MGGKRGRAHHVTAGDLNRDGFADIITGAGPGGGPHVEAFSGKDGSLLQSFFPYEQGFHGGVFVGTGDINNDGRGDIIAGPGEGGGPQLVAVDAWTLAPLINVQAFNPEQPGAAICTGSTLWSSGLRVAVGDFNNDGNADVVVGPGSGKTSRLNRVNGATSAVTTGPVVFDPAFLGGVFIAVA